MCFEISFFLNLRPQYVMEIPSVVWEARFPCWFAVPWGAEVAGCSRTIGAAQWNETAILQERPLWYFWNSQGHTLQGLKNWSHFLAQKNGWWTLQSMMLNMPGRRCRWCSNPDKIYISRFVFLKQRVGQMGETSLDFPIFSSFFFLAGQDMVPNSVRLKDEKPLLDSHIFGSAKLEAK